MVFNQASAVAWGPNGIRTRIWRWISRARPRGWIRTPFILTRKDYALLSLLPS